MLILDANREQGNALLLNYYTLFYYTLGVACSRNTDA